MGGDEGPKNLWGEPNDQAREVTGSCLGRTTNSLAVGGLAGTFFGACQIAWYPDPLTTSRGIVKKTEWAAVLKGAVRPAVLFAAAGAAFSSVECLAEASRSKKDSWNSVLGGMAAGVVMASTTKRFDVMTSTALATGLFLGLLDFSGPSTVANPLEVKQKMHNMLPQTHVETDDLRALKEKYPKFQDL